MIPKLPKKSRNDFRSVNELIIPDAYATPKPHLFHENPDVTKF